MEQVLCVLSWSTEIVCRIDIAEPFRSLVRTEIPESVRYCKVAMKRGNWDVEALPGVGLQGGIGPPRGYARLFGLLVCQKQSHSCSHRSSHASDPQST